MRIYRLWLSDDNNIVNWTCTTSKASENQLLLHIIHTNDFNEDNYIDKQITNICCNTL